MGVERAVTRWHIQHQRLTNEIAALEAQLDQAPFAEQQDPPADSERQDFEQRLAELHTQLRTLGPCPKPMMG